MSERKRRIRESNLKHVEYVGYKIEPPLNNEIPLWCLKRPTGQILKHYKHQARAITGALIDIQRAAKRHETHGDLNAHWQRYIKRFKEYDPEA